MRWIQRRVLTGVLFAALASSVWSQPHDLDQERVWIHHAPGKADAVLRALDRSNARIHYQFPSLNVFASSVPSQALPGLRRNPNITLVEEDPERYPLSQSIPYGVDAVQARDVWDADGDHIIDVGAPTGAGRLVCVIDSGLYQGHEDLSGVNVVGGYPASSWRDDTCGHGTHVAGTLNAVNNGVGVVGVSPGKASLYIVKVFDGASCGWSYSSDLVDAALRCQEAGAHIISMSLGGSRKAKAEDMVFQDLDREGIFSIAAAGNDGSKRKSYPASYDSVMSVAAVDQNNVVADFSQQNSAVEIAAPGVGVFSTVPWMATNTLTVGEATYSGAKIENAAEGSVSDYPLVDGGLCDSTGGWVDRIVLCERGDISFFDKVKNVENSGGLAVAIFNNEPGSFVGTLGDGNSSEIPAISLSQEDGADILASGISALAGLVSQTVAPASGYEAWSGTSMATPHVAGVAALVWSSSPGLSNQAIRDALTSTALDLGDPGRDNASGYGLVQAADAVAFLGGDGGEDPVNQPPSASFTFSCTLLDCSFDASQSGDIDGGIVSYDWDFGDGSTFASIYETSSHSFDLAGSYIVTLKVTDNAGATSTSSQTVTVSDGSDGAPVISEVTSVRTKGHSFEISWNTDIAADSMVTFTCCGDFTDSTLVTEHKMGFRGSRGVLYEYWVSSTGAAGLLTTAGPLYSPELNGDRFPGYAVK